MKRMTVAEYLTKAIDMSGLTQREIALAIGYPKPNVISMMKQGQTKVPIDKVPLFAKALGVDPVFLMRLTIQEYLPEVWDAMIQVIGDIPTGKERELVEVYRSADPNNELVLDTTAKQRLKDTIRSLANGSASDGVAQGTAVASGGMSH